MASLSSPIGPTIDVVSKTISRSVISGGGGGQRGGAIVPVSRMVEPGALVAPPPPPTISPQEIGALKKQIGALVKRDSEQLAAYNNLIGFLQNQFKTIGVTVRDLGSNLNATNKLLQSDAQLEQQQQTQEVVEQKKAAESEYRQGAEKLLEQKIQAALMAPVKAIGSQLQLTLGNLMRFFGILFTGWLVDKAIELFKADAEGNKRKFEDIKNAIIKNLFIAGGVLTVLNIGIFKIAGKIASLAFKLGRFVLSNTLGKLFSGIAALAGRMASATKTFLGMGEKPAPAAAAGKGAAAGAEKGAAAGVEKGAAAGTEKGAAAGAEKGLLGNVGKAVKGATGPLNVLFGGMEFFDRKSEGQTDVQAGSGAVTSVVGSELLALQGAKTGSQIGGVFGPVGRVVGGFLGGVTGGIGGWYGGGKVSDVITGVGDTPAKSTDSIKSTPPKSTTPTSTTSTPQEKAVPSSSTSIQPPKTPLPAASPQQTALGQPSSTGKSPNIQETYKQVSYPEAPIVPYMEQNNNINTTNTTNNTVDRSDSFVYNSNETTNLQMGDNAQTYSPTSPTSLISPTTTTSSSNSFYQSFLNPEFFVDQKSGDVNISPIVAETEKMPSSPVVGPAPAPKPNVIYASSRKNQSSDIKAPLKSGPASDVPFIPSSNPDNFYLLYSQVQYNIVS